MRDGVLRREAIKDLLRTKEISTQEALSDELRALGYSSAAGTVSRDLAKLEVKKIDGLGYVLGEDEALAVVASSFATSCEVANNLVVIGTSDGSEAMVAKALRESSLFGVMCAMESRETILVVCDGDYHAKFTQEVVKRFMAR